jgi:membrane protease YdiL (CAAX protease family)
MATSNLSWLKHNDLVLYFVLAYLLSWSVFIPIALSANGLIPLEIPLAYHYLGSFGPMVAAIIVMALTRGRQGLRILLAGLLKWRVEARYYAFAVLAPVGLFILAVLLNRLVTGAWPDLSLLGEADYLPYLGPLAVLGLWLLTYGLGEETGWRGYALPRLQRARPATSATLILAILWAGWHIPALFYRDTYTELGWLAFPMLLVSLVFAAMLFTWLYNSTQGSILLVILFHAFFNWLSVSEAGGQFVAVLMTIPVIGWALYVVRRYGPESASPLPKQVL